ncbi:MAG: hypothetical protein QOD84_2277, partial [Acidobacteriaceae bacterium]
SYRLPPRLEELWDFEGRSDLPDLPESSDLPELPDLDDWSDLLSDLDSDFSEEADFELVCLESKSDFAPESDFELESLLEPESPLEDEALEPDFFA